MQRLDDDTKTRLINAAEELYATHGIAGVSTRQITRFAKQRNESAMHYHFGNRENMIQTIVDRHSRTIDERRNALLDALEEGGEQTGRLERCRAICACIALPLLDLIREMQGSRYYVRFLAEVLHSQNVEGLEAIWRRNNKGMQRCLDALRHELSDLPDVIFIKRFTIIISSMIAGLASIERACCAEKRRGEDYEPTLDAENLLDLATSAFCAPVSGATRTAYLAAPSSENVQFWPPKWIAPSIEE